VTISVTDTNPAAVNAKSLSATNSFTVTVNEVNVAPVLPNQNNRTNNELVTLTVTNTASDSDLPANVLIYQLIAPPAGALIDTNGVFTWTPSEAQGPGIYTITTVVADNGTPNLHATNSFTVTVNEVNSAPVLPAQFTRTVRKNTLMTVANTATDSDIPTNILTYTLLVKPTGALIDNNGVITWTTSPNQAAGDYTFTTVVTDNGTPNLSATNTFIATVTAGTVNTAPVLPAQTNQAVNEQSPLVVTNTGLDSNFPANNLSYSLLAPPSGVAIDANGIITWTPTEVQGPSTNTITTVVTDDGTPALSATNSFTVVVNEVNTAPVLPGQGTRTIAVLATLTVTNTATDSDLPGNPLTYSLIAAPSGASIDASSGVISWTPNAGQAPSTNAITTVVTDFNLWAINSQHLSATNSFTVIVTGSAPSPVLQSITVSNGVATIKWSSVSNLVYRLQYLQNLTDAAWSNTVPDFTATGSSVTATNAISNSAQRYYRVMLVP